jgi:hypothetical protein
VLISYSDAVTYTLRAATEIKVFYPNLIHFTYLAHGLKHVVEEVRAKFSRVKTLILMEKKKLFLNAPHKMQSYKRHLSEAPLLPLTSASKMGNLDRSSQLIQ